MRARVYRKAVGAAARWYVGWHDGGRHHVRVCGAGEQGRKQAEQLRRTLEAGRGPGKEALS